MDASESNRPASGRAAGWIKVTLVLGLVVAIYLQIDVGMGDETDFLRAARWLADSPVGQDNVTLDDGAIKYTNRYFLYYLPYWKYTEATLLDRLMQIGEAKTSTALLWLPGLLVNYFAYSAKVLYLPVLSLLPRLLLVGGLFALFAWIEANCPSRRAFLYLVLGLPSALLLLTTDYVAYLNSFYQETGSLIYLGLWIASLLYLRGRPQSWRRGWLCLGALSLLVCAKASNIYWVVVGVVFLATVWRPWGLTSRWRIALALAMYVALTGATLGIYIACASPGLRRPAPFRQVVQGYPDLQQ